MEADLSLILLVIAGIILIFLFIYSFKTRVRPEDLEHSEQNEFDFFKEKSKNSFQQMPTVNQNNFKIDESVDQIIPQRVTEPAKKSSAVESPKTQSKSAMHIEPTMNKIIIEDDLIPVTPIIKKTTRVQEQPTVESIQPEKPAKVVTDFQPLPLLMLHVMPADQGQKFIGYDLLQALLAAKLRFGKMSIFHRHEQANGDGKILFSVAQVTEPGTFSIDSMGGCHCDGLVLFMQLLGSEQNLEALDKFIQTAEQLSDSLNGIVMGKRGIPFTAELKKQFIASVEYHLANHKLT